MASRYYSGLGRRKTSVARVRLYQGGDAFIINGKPAEEFFTRQEDMAAALQPLRLTNNEGSFMISVVVKGGGISGQAGAIRHGIARALQPAG